jgi:hypothetical protein
MNTPARPDREPARPDSQETASPSKQLLEEVVRQTLVESAPAGEQESLELERLIAVARRHRAERLPTGPIVGELVETLLLARFPRLPATPQFWDAVSAEIAASLMDDPHQMELLERFWSKLCDKAA